MIEIAGISHDYVQLNGARTVAALRDVSLTIENGSFVSWLGPSGCGKTTLLQIANGMFSPATGEVRIDGATVDGPSADRAMVFQDFSLLPWRTARSNVAMPLEILGIDRRERQRITASALSQVGLEGFADFYPHQLSGGMKQRVGLARALAVDPTYLFMDEPFGALDPQIREMMQVELLRLLDDNRKTVVFVTHSVDEAVFLSDRIVVFSAQPGRVIADIAIDLPRPRWKDEESLRQSPQFLDYRNHIWRLLKQQLRDAPGHMSRAESETRRPRLA